MLKILLADLRHKTIGSHSAVMPLAIGFLATYTESFLKKNVSDYAVVNFAINEKIFGFIHCSWLNPKKERNFKP